MLLSCSDDLVHHLSGRLGRNMWVFLLVEPNLTDPSAEGDVVDERVLKRLLAMFKVRLIEIAHVLSPLSVEMKAFGTRSIPP